MPATSRAPGVGRTLAAEHLSLAYDDTIICDDLSVEIPHGEVTVIVGANACGKSTLLRGLARLLRPVNGTVLLDGSDIGRLPTKEVATRLGILPQQPVAPEGITVADLVARGRNPHQRFFRQWTDADEAALHRLARATRFLLTGMWVRPVEGSDEESEARSLLERCVAPEFKALL